MKFTPRDYQKEGLDALRNYYDDGLNRLLGVMATGMGKSSGVAMNLPDWFPELMVNDNGEGGMLFIAHRISIIQQTYAKFKAAYPKLWIGLEQGENHCTGQEDIVFASVDSLGRLMSNRIFKYEKRKFGIIVQDEAHHCAPSNTFDNVLTFFGVGSDPRTHFTLKGGRKPLSLFLTATPERSDGQSIAPFLDRCPTETGAAFCYDILYGIRNGWLTDIRAYQATPSGKPFADMETEERVKHLVRVWKDYASNMQTLCFAGSVDESSQFAQALNDYNLCEAGHIQAETPDELRTELYEKGEAGELDLLSNRFVLTEGWDAPWVDCILDAAPSSHQTTHVQKLGRGLRTAPDARVDDYDTAEQRREAIKNSSKDALTYISTFDPTEHNVTIVGAIWEGNDVDAEGKRVVEEVIDVIQQEQEENPERPLDDITSISDLEVQLSKVDVWSQTIENDRLQAITPLRWIATGDGETKRHASLYLPWNPRASNPYEDTEVIYHLRHTKPGRWRFIEIIVGGWVEELGRPVKAQVRPLGWANHLGEAIREIDSNLEQNATDLFNELKRGANAPATEDQKRYMKNHGISFGQGVTEETANLLIDDFRCKRKMKNVNIDSSV